MRIGMNKQKGVSIMSTIVNQTNNYQSTEALLKASAEQNKPQGTTASGAGQEQSASMLNKDVFEKSSQTNQTYKPDYATIQKMMQESNEKVDSFRQLLERIFNKQGMTFNEAIGRLRESLGGDGTTFKVEIDEETRRKAEEDISEDGYWGVNQTSGRIMDFAKALSGGDPSKIELLRGAVQKAFDKAEKQWGEKLPEVSQKTYTEVMRRFDEWAQESQVKSPNEPQRAAS